MAKKRRQNWERGAPRPPTGEPQPIRSDASSTANINLTGGRTVESTWDPSRQGRANFAPIHPSERQRRVFPLSAGWFSAVLVAIGLFAGAILYVSGMRTEISVAGAKIEALQKSHDSWTSSLRAEILRVETSLDAKLTRLSDILQGRQPSREKGSSTREQSGSERR